MSDAIFCAHQYRDDEHCPHCYTVRLEQQLAAAQERIVELQHLLTSDEHDKWAKVYREYLGQQERITALKELSKAQDQMLAIYRSGNHHRAGPVIDRMEAARAKITRMKNGDG